MKRFLQILILICLFLNRSQGIEFEFYGAPLNIECFGESLNENALLVGEVRSSSNYIDVTLYDPNGKLLFSKSNETIFKFSVTANVAGTYQTCIKNLSRQFLNYVVKIDTGVFAKDYSEMAKTHNLKPIEVVLKKTEDIVKEVQSTTSTFIQNKEETIDKLEFVNTKIIVFSIITIVIMVILSFCQATYLKRFFKSKKLL